MIDEFDIYAPDGPSVATIAASWEAVSAALWRFRGTEAAQGMLVASLRGAKMRKREGVFQQFSTLLQFPDYFGENWNAFKDCVADLDWLRTKGVLLVISQSELLLADGDPDELSVFVDILRHAANALGSATSTAGGVSLRVVLQVSADRAEYLKRRLLGLAPTTEAR
jgi:Barstar (barnase inhibitor)